MWRAYQEARVEAALKGKDIRLLIHLPVFEFAYGLNIYRVFPMPIVTSKDDTIAHSWKELAPYLGVSPDQQLFVEFTMDEARRCMPFMESVCPFLKPIDKKSRITSCTAAVFLQDQQAVQEHCRLEDKKWTGTELFYIGARRWGYASKANISLMIQCPLREIGDVGLRQQLPTAGIIKIPRLCAAISEDWVLQASFKQVLSINASSNIHEEATMYIKGLLTPETQQTPQRITATPLLEESPSALKPPSRIEGMTTDSHIKAVESLRQQLDNEEAGKRYPFEWTTGIFALLPLSLYLLYEHRRLRANVDLLLLAQAKELVERKQREDPRETPSETSDKLLQEGEEQTSPV